MLSVTATDILVLVDPSTLKRSSASLPASTTLSHKPTAAAWAVDNSVLYLSSTHTIARYDPLSNELKDIFSLEEPLEIQCLVVKDNDIIIFSAETTISVLQCGDSTVKVLQALTPHKGKVVSLSLSNASTLLAAASKDSVLVYNFASGSHSTLRGLPSAEPITICSFHPHTRTRLLVAAGRQLLIYDTTRLSSSPKTVILNEAISGSTVAIASSPFSKTLVATASSDGYVSLIDLDKEKGLFRTLNLKVSLTTLSFSPEGATMYLGTKDGRLLIIDLRALDKPPKCVIVSEMGNTVDTLCIQKKANLALDEAKATSTGVVNKAPRFSSSSKPTSTPIKARNSQIISATPSGRPSLNQKTGTPRRTSSIKNDKKVLTPSRDPLGNSINRGLKTTKSEMLKPSRTTPEFVSPKPKLPRNSVTRTSLTIEAKQNTSVTSNRIRKETIAAKPTSTPPSESATAIETSLPAKRRANRRPHANVEPTRINSRSVHTAPPPSKESSPSSRKKTTSSPTTLSAVPSTSASIAQHLQRGTRLNALGESRTPSPELPSMHTSAHPTTPPKKKKKGMVVLGLGTPDVKAWVNAKETINSPERGTSRDKGKGKVAGYHDEQDDEYKEGISHVKEIDSGDNQQDNVDKQKHDGNLSIQISPRRLTPTSMRSQNQSWEASPLRASYTAHPSTASTPGNAHELLRTIVQDVMYDFQRETKAEMMGLHLDLIKMGRGWKQELRTLMDEYVGDLNDLREENKRLREENERLRRGY